jgi:hypothetical protein
MVSYYLWDYKTSGNWSDDGYIYPHLLPEERNVPISTSEYMVSFQDQHVPSSKNGVERFGNLIFMKTPQCLVQLVSIKGGHGKEVEGADWWYWTPDSLTFHYKIHSKILPQFATINFQYLSTSAQTMNVTIQGNNLIKTISHEIHPEWGNFHGDISIPGPEMLIKITSLQPPVPISETDSRLAKFLIKNIEIIPKGCEKLI